MSHCLPFLDVTVMREGDKFHTSLYRKKTVTGLYSRFDSFIPKCYKAGLVWWLLIRAFRICSNFAHLHAEIAKLAELFALNGYPTALFNQLVLKFLNSYS